MLKLVLINNITLTSKNGQASLGLSLMLQCQSPGMNIIPLATSLKCHDQSMIISWLFTLLSDFLVQYDINTSFN